MAIKVWSMSPSFGYFTTDGLDYLQTRGYQVDRVAQTAKMTEAEIIEKIGSYDALISGLMPITANVIRNAPHLKIITQPGAGVDHIDVKAASKNAITVTNAPGVNKDAVAELTFGFFISLARRIPFGDSSVRQGQWPKVVGSLLKGKTLGIIGMGKIGKTVAHLGKAFGMTIVAYDVYKDESFAQANNVQYLALDELMSRSDFISIHVFLSETTRNLIGEKEIGRMKPTAFLVNVARGGVVCESSLYDALKNKSIAGAALDVLSQEPPPAHMDLYDLDNVILTPHLGGYAVEVAREIGLICARNIHSFFSGRQLENLVNPEATH
ncbi:phosphoglycerate dehydrogenase [Desulfosarcina widdelii]|nr:phosphoglycerate dehydrogenase [Desulfosarcina widdelii]